MAKWYGKIGYAITEETEPGLWEPKKVTLFSWERTDKVNRIQQVADYLF